MNKKISAAIEFYLHNSSIYNFVNCFFSQMIVSATMSVYKEAMLTFLPTPTKSHYTFSLRDFSRVIRGVMLVPAARLKEAEKLIRLWIHESYRVFNDRLIDSDDRYINKIAVAVFFKIF